MNRYAMIGSATLMLAAIPAFAQSDARPAGEMTRAAVEAQVRDAFARVDTNRDGFVTQPEGEASRAVARAGRQEQRSERRDALFARLDANKDGSISRAEFDAPRGDRAEKRGERREARGERRAHRGGQGFVRFGGKAFERFDGNKDGRVSLQEATAQALARFDRIDANRDGTISADERRAAFQARRRG
ncbi:EF-hand domain-containing protein [Sphingomonas sp. LY54]|uniref:EF-hand domain-containing protein n=1 Tax=Sphingomonas sp. LY54 TaxID=3095343 RepID=UPI002D7A1FD6|nr:EF-hand domain-containing protein [Sphingomonas sp. LY54]WRP28112.1 EF-hand domain-containing protein [Sphingomonas sp. LY54]